MAEPKEKKLEAMRPPAKKKLGLVVPPALRLPHEDLIRAEVHAQIPESPVTHASPCTDASPSKSAILALSNESPSVGASPSTHDSPKAEKRVEYRPGDSRINNDFFDDRLCGLDAIAQALYFHLNRYRQGGTSHTVVLSWKRLMERIPVSESTLRRAYTQLNKAGLAVKERDVFGKGGQQGIIFRVVMGERASVDARASMDDSNKRKDLKDNSKRDLASPNFQNCPDCSGTGFQYVDELDRSKGVEKCSHAKLKT